MQKGGFAMKRKVIITILLIFLIFILTSFTCQTKALIRFEDLGNPDAYISNGRRR